MDRDYIIKYIDLDTQLKSMDEAIITRAKEIAIALDNNLNDCQNFDFYIEANDPRYGRYSQYKTLLYLNWSYYCGEYCNDSCVFPVDFLYCEDFLQLEVKNREEERQKALLEKEKEEKEEKMMKEVEEYLHYQKLKAKYEKAEGISFEVH